MKQNLSFGEITIPIGDQVRISTLNLLHNPDMMDDRLEHFSEALGKTLPDILCLQEVIFESETDSLILKKLEASTHLMNTVSHQQHEIKDGNLSGDAIMSSMPTVESGIFHLGIDTKVAYGLYGVFEHNDNVFIAINVHLHWGGNQEYGRLQQLVTVNSFAEELRFKYSERNPTIVLAGDFNADPDGEAVRYLGGKTFDTQGNGTFWTDAWVTHGNTDNEYTMLPSNHWAIETAKGQNIFLPQFMPKRRIDYVFSYGWAYGKPGTPLNFSTDYDSISKYGYPISDHSGITVDYWVK